MKGLFLFLGLIVPIFLWSQEDTPKNWSLNGYIKNLQSLFFIEDIYFQDNLIHNRLNFTWYLNDNWTFKSDLRSRFFFGDLVRANDNYAQLVDNANNDFLDLSLVLLDNNGIVLHSMLDRLYFEYIKNNWEIRLGRQRVNWGISTVWNPNDIFNAFNFTDFDYEERPGSDALRIKYYSGYASSFEIALKAFDQFEDAVAAGLLKFNRWNYDFQILGGLANENIVLGGGWAGNLKNAGFKAEFSYFFALDDKQQDSFNGTVGLDYSFSNALYFNIGYLYNSNGANNASITNLFDFNLSARSLYPYRHATFLQFTYPIHPLLTAGVATIYSPVAVHPLFFNPTITYSIKSNWDLDLIGQIVFEEKGNFRSPIQAIFLRIKYSF